MIYITGDIHGSPERLGVHSFYEQKVLPVIEELGL